MKISARYYHKCSQGFVYLARYLSTNFRRILWYQISWKSVWWEPSYSMRTDRRDEAASRLSQFCARAKKMSSVRWFVQLFASLVAWLFTYLPRECGGWQSRRRRPSHCTGRKFTQKQTTNTRVELQCGVLCLPDSLYEFDLVSAKKILPLNATNCLAKLTCI